MKRIIGKAILFVSIATVLLSFSVNFGGEGFEIFLNNKVVLQQFGKQVNKVNNLQLGQVDANDLLTIKYYHCGRVGKNRIVSIKDAQNNTLREWHFTNGTSVTGMNCKIKDILSVQKNNAVLRLYYSSNELPNGRLLTNIVAPINSMAKLK